MRNTHGAPIWYELMTPDAAAAGAFYAAVLGWRLGPKPPDELDYRMIEVGDGQVGGVLQLTGAMSAGGARPRWLFYLGVEDVDAAAKGLRAAGGDVLREPWDIPGAGRAAMVADPQGVPFYIMRGAVDAVSGAFDPDSPGHVAWNELTTSDDAAALAFYRDRFGWTSNGAMPMGEMGDYHFLDHGGRTVGAAMRAAEDAPHGWTFYFRVDDVAAAATRVTMAGGALHYGPAPVPGGNIIVASDPQGARFGLVDNKGEKA